MLNNGTRRYLNAGLGVIRRWHVQESPSICEDRVADFDAIRHQLQTGDILLFSGRSLISRLIRLFTRGRWSHIGIIVRDVASDDLFLWEATSNNTISDVEFGHIPRGVQLVSLEEKLRSYNGIAAVRFLEGVERNAKMMKRFRWLFKRLRRAPYRNYLVEYLNIGIRGNRRAANCAFCSQLVAEAYMRMRLLRLERPSAFYTPNDFAKDRSLPLKHGKLTAPMVLII